MSAGIPPTAVEANDQTSGHAIEIFKAWQKSLPAVEWTAATVDRDEGLVLESRLFLLHFRHVNCGYSGSGPIDAARILELAGFTADEANYVGLRTQLCSSTRRHRFTKP